MREVAADAGTFAEGVGSASGSAGVLVIEGDVVMDVIADGLHARIAGRGAAEELPGDVG